MEDALMVQRAVILTALPVEYLAVRSHLTDLQEIFHPNGSIYERGMFTSDWDVAIVETGAGNLRMALEVEQAIAYFQPKIVLLVGIAAGIKDVQIGDVVVSSKVYSYESGIAGETFRPRPQIGLSTYRLEQQARSEARKSDWLKRLSVFEPLSTILKVEPRVFVAPIAAGEKIIASTQSDIFQFLRSNYGDAIAVEMEGMGFLSAAQAHANVSAIVIRGISDLIDNIKTDKVNYQEIAARNASAFAFEIISKLSTLPQQLASKKRNLIVSRVEIYNIRCFEHIIIDLDCNKQHHYWTMILGDNAIGKSTVLKSIALGLCNESDAIALIKEMPGDFLRKGAEKGSIIIHLREDKQSQRPRKYSITTRIIKNVEDETEIVRQETTPAENFPWADIFVCGYGSTRSTQAYNSYEQYKVIDAVKSLFDSQAFLQNPEVVLLRQDPSVRAILEEKLQSILMLDTPEYKIHYTKRGLELDGSWGRMPVQVLSDGYRSTTQWVLDFIGWLIIAERLIGNPDIGGILIIDEIEQHLHPRWQRYIVQRLRQQFPKTQIIASTHTPLVAAGIADVDRSMLLKLDRNEDSEITVQIIDKELIAGKRADQVLTSEAFGLVTTRNNRSHDDVDRYTELLGKQTRTESEAAELEHLRSVVQNRLSNGETATSQLVEKAVDEALQDIITNVSPEMLDVETKKQLRALFQSEN
jgi:nucleoside phosphorylase/ABC-type cobalamin/Fe3+-siderophores transport system ATPase subunit